MGTCRKESNSQIFLNLVKESSFVKKDLKFCQIKRKYLIELLISICKELELPIKAIHHSWDLFQRIMIKNKSISQEKEKMYLGVCFNLSLKYLESKMLTPESFFEIFQCSNQKFSRFDYGKLELEVLRKLGFKVNSINLNSFLEIFLSDLECIFKKEYYVYSVLLLEKIQIKALQSDILSYHSLLDVSLITLIACINSMGNVFNLPKEMIEDISRMINGKYQKWIRIESDSQLINMFTIC